MDSRIVTRCGEGKRLILDILHLGFSRTCYLFGLGNAKHGIKELFALIINIENHLSDTLAAEMSQHSSKSSFNYDTLGDIPLFYIPTPPPPALIVETEPRSRWSVDTEDLEAVRCEASAVVTLTH